MKDPIVDRSQNQKRIRLELARLELRPLGYSIVRTDWLRNIIKKLPPTDRAEAMMEAAR